MAVAFAGAFAAGSTSLLAADQDLSAQAAQAAAQRAIFQRTQAAQAAQAQAEPSQLEREAKKWATAHASQITGSQSAGAQDAQAQAEPSQLEREAKKWAAAHGASEPRNAEGGQGSGQDDGNLDIKRTESFESGQSSTVDPGVDSIARQDLQKMLGREPTEDELAAARKNEKLSGRSDPLAPARPMVHTSNPNLGTGIKIISMLASDTAGDAKTDSKVEDQVQKDLRQMLGRAPTAEELAAAKQNEAQAAASQNTMPAAVSQTQATPETPAVQTNSPPETKQPTEATKLNAVTSAQAVDPALDHLARQDLRQMLGREPTEEELNAARKNEKQAGRTDPLAPAREMKAEPFNPNVGHGIKIIS